MMIVSLLIYSLTSLLKNMNKPCIFPKTQITADNLSNAKPLVQQRHPGDEFPVSQRGSAKGKQSVPVPILLMDIYLYRK